MVTKLVLRVVRSLRWKVAVSAAVSLAVGLMSIALVLMIGGAVADQELLARETVRPSLHRLGSSFASKLGPVLKRPDPAVIASWLAVRRPYEDLGLPIEIASEDGGLDWAVVTLSRIAVADSGGRLLGDWTAGGGRAGGLLAESVPEPALPTVRAALQGLRDVPDLVVRDPQTGDTYVASPVFGGAGEVLGAVFFEAETGPLSALGLLKRSAGVLPHAVGRGTLVAVLVGLLVGVLTSHWLVGRLRRLSRATRSWAEGDLAQRVGDGSVDELGQLARSLDDMAEQLGALMDSRERLAATEERNHLACELHDTVKQKVFSVSMLLGSVDLLFDSDRRAARSHLADARRAAEDSGRELVALIDQLRPTRAGVIGLATSLRDYVADWSSDQGIAASVTVRPDRRFPIEVEENLFRVAQEALANVARHSRASEVEVRVTAESREPEEAGGEQIRLRVEDNGVGFDQAAGAVGGFGLESMATRMRSLGGRLFVDSVLGQGTAIVAECSVPEPQAQGA